MNGCELCDLKPLTRRHYTDDLMVICDCLTCGIPMLVFRGHGLHTEEEHRRAREKLIELYGKRLIKIRTKARLIKEHNHWHIYLEKQ